MTGRVNYWRVAALVLVAIAIGEAYALRSVLPHATIPNTASSGAPHRVTADRRQDPWFQDMVDWYYPVRNTEQWEEMFIRDFFRDRRGGFLVDVGASDYRAASTTYYLDRHMGWHGIAIDAIDGYRAGYERHRPRTKFFAFYVSDRSDRDAEFFLIPGDKRKSTGVKAVADEHKRAEALDATVIHVPTITLNDLLAKNGVQKVDLLSMDIELAEPAALAGFDIDKYRPDLVVIETHGQIKAQLFDLFQKHGYVSIERYAKYDVRNTYFTTVALYEEWKRRGNPWDETATPMPSPVSRQQ